MAHVGDTEAGVGLGLLVVFIACQGSVERLYETDSATKNSKKEKGGGETYIWVLHVEIPVNGPRYSIVLLQVEGEVGKLRRNRPLSQWILLRVQ